MSRCYASRRMWFRCVSVGGRSRFGRFKMREEIHYEKVATYLGLCVPDDLFC